MKKERGKKEAEKKSNRSQGDSSDMGRLSSLDVLGESEQHKVREYRVKPVNNKCPLHHDLVCFRVNSSQNILRDMRFAIIGPLKPSESSGVST